MRRNKSYSYNINLPSDLATYQIDKKMGGNINRSWQSFVRMGGWQYKQPPRAAVALDTPLC